MKDKLPIFYFCSLISRHFPQSSSRCVNCCRLHVTLNLIRLTHSADYTWPETPLAHRFKWNNLIDPTRCRGRREGFRWRTRRQLNKLTIHRLEVSNKVFGKFGGVILLFIQTSQLNKVWWCATADDDYLLSSNYTIQCFSVLNSASHLIKFKRWSS